LESYQQELETAKERIDQNEINTGLKLYELQEEN
jgi:hypothetical protein